MEANTCATSRRGENQPTADHATDFTRRPVFPVKAPVNVSLSQETDKGNWSESQPNPIPQVPVSDPVIEPNEPVLHCLVPTHHAQVRFPECVFFQRPCCIVGKQVSKLDHRREQAHFLGGRLELFLVPRVLTKFPKFPVGALFKKKSSPYGPNLLASFHLFPVVRTLNMS